MSILATPIDIKFALPDHDILSAWIDRNCINDTTWWAVQAGMHDTAIVATREAVMDWRSPQCFRNWQQRRQTMISDYYLQFAPDICDMFPDLNNLLNKLPFDQIGVVALLKQKSEVPLHYDTPDHTKPMEPRRYIAYLSDPNDNTFYMNYDGVDYPVTISDQRRVIAFNSTEATHGATAPLNPKIILSVVGILNHSCHEELITRSIQKFPDQVLYS